MAKDDSILSYCARLRLAEDLGLKPEELDYLGPWEPVPGDRIEMFNVVKPGHELNYSTRSVRIA